MLAGDPEEEGAGVVTSGEVLLRQRVQQLERCTTLLATLMCLASLIGTMLVFQQVRRLDSRIQSVASEMAASVVSATSGNPNVTIFKSDSSPPPSSLQRPVPAQTPAIRMTSPPTDGTVEPASTRPATTKSPSASPVQASPSGQCCKAFADREELLGAVDAYLELLVSTRSGEPVLTPDDPLALQYGTPIGSWDVSRIADFSSLFDAHARNTYAKFFNDDISQWNMASARNMSAMFRGAEVFDSDVSDWNVANVNDMSFLFSGYRLDSESSSTLTVFNQPLETWDVSNVVTMEGMFELNQRFDQSLSQWNVSQVKTMKCMFHGAAAFNRDLAGWDVARVEDMSRMFGAHNFADDSGFNQSLTWDTSSVQDMSGMFQYSSFNAPLYFDTSNVRNMDQTFFCAHEFNQESVSDWDTSRVVSMASTFRFANSFDQPLQGWNVSQVTSMQFMFGRASSFNQPLSAWDVSRVVTMAGMFYQNSEFNQDVSAWQVLSLEDMSVMFQGNIRYNHTLCAWGTRLKRSTKVEGAFLETNCSETGDPNMGATPPGPFCGDCSS